MHPAPSQTELGGTGAGRTGGSRLAPSGPVLFARYAYGPNRLGLCGPDDAEGLFGEGVEGATQGVKGAVQGRGQAADRRAVQGPDHRELRELAAGFVGAFPYLELIARANSIADPLDRRVVEAYWLGSPLLENVTPELLGESLRARFRPRLGKRTWEWLKSSAPSGAKPVHAFHVLDVFPKVGLMRAEQADRILETLDSCRIRWGRVQERVGDTLIVNAVPLALLDGKLTLGQARPEQATGWRDGKGFLGEVAVGDVVSIHWNWACDVLDPDQLGRLMGWTQRQLSIANQTI